MNKLDKNMVFLSPASSALPMSRDEYISRIEQNDQDKHRLARYATRQFGTVGTASCLDRFMIGLSLGYP